ncbi:MAG: hypothetical protein AAFO06_12775 [Cyanobacteria bacterium J06597_16]
MTRYTDPISTDFPSKFPSGPMTDRAETPLSKTPQMNLVGAPRKLTTTPQMSFSDFRAYRTPHGLEVYFPQQRIQEQLSSPVPLLKLHNLKEIKKSREDLLGLPLSTIVATIFFVGGAVAVTGSPIFGIIVAAVLPGLLWIIESLKEDEPQGKTVLKITAGRDGQPLLTLRTVSPTQHKSSSLPKRKKNISLKSTVHCVSLPISTIKTAYASFSIGHSSQVIFTFKVGQQLRGYDQLTITGTRKEIQWLHRHLRQQQRFPTG